MKKNDTYNSNIHITINTMKSKKYKLNKEDASKVGKGALIAVGGALVTFVAEVVTQIDFGEWTPLVVAGASIGINLARKYLQGLKK